MKKIMIVLMGAEAVKMMMRRRRSQLMTRKNQTTKIHAMC
jgi:hypothetical protein